MSRLNVNEGNRHIFSQQLGVLRVFDNAESLGHSWEKMSRSPSGERDALRSLEILGVVFGAGDFAATATVVLPVPVARVSSTCGCPLRMASRARTRCREAA
jgi:hypothetical protein